MCVGSGVEMLRKQYFAGFKEDRAAAYPTVPIMDVQVDARIDGTIDDVFAKAPELEPCLYNDVKVCTGCGKPCAYTMFVCNSCGKDLPTELTKSENVFTAFLFGVKTAKKGFPYIISLRRETSDVLIFDDMLALSGCHFNCISKKYYIPDWRYLLLCPQESLKLLDTMENELWEASLVFLRNPAYKSYFYREGVTEEDIRKCVASSFNFPPSQFQMHIQWQLLPLFPFQHFMAEKKNHFHEGRAFPMPYVRKVLAMDKPYEVTKDTPITDIIEYYKGLGVDYTTEWTEWYQKIGLGGTLEMQNWNPDDFQYVVEDGKVNSFSVVDGKVKIDAEVPDVDPVAVQTKDKAAMQNYGRPYSAVGKPTGTYIINALETKFGAGGYQTWPDRGATVDGVKEVSTSSTGAACGSCSVS